MARLVNFKEGDRVRSKKGSPLLEIIQADDYGTVRLKNLKTGISFKEGHPYFIENFEPESSSRDPLRVGVFFEGQIVKNIEDGKKYKVTKVTNAYAEVVEEDAFTPIPQSYSAETFLRMFRSESSWEEHLEFLRMFRSESSWEEHLEKTTEKGEEPVEESSSLGVEIGEKVIDKHSKIVWEVYGKDPVSVMLKIDGKWHTTKTYSRVDFLQTFEKYTATVRQRNAQRRALDNMFDIHVGQRFLQRWNYQQYEVLGVGEGVVRLNRIRTATLENELQEEEKTYSEMMYGFEEATPDNAFFLLEPNWIVRKKESCRLYAVTDVRHGHGMVVTLKSLENTEAIQIGCENFVNFGYEVLGNGFDVWVNSLGHLIELEPGAGMLLKRKDDISKDTYQIIRVEDETCFVQNIFTGAIADCAKRDLGHSFYATCGELYSKRDKEMMEKQKTMLDLRKKFRTGQGVVEKKSCLIWVVKAVSDKSVKIVLEGRGDVERDYSLQDFMNNFELYEERKHKPRLLDRVKERFSPGSTICSSRETKLFHLKSLVPCIIEGETGGDKAITLSDLYYSYDRYEGEGNGDKEYFPEEQEEQKQPRVGAIVVWKNKKSKKNHLILGDKYLIIGEVTSGLFWKLNNIEEGSRWFGDLCSACKETFSANWDVVGYQDIPEPVSGLVSDFDRLAEQFPDFARALRGEALWTSSEKAFVERTFQEQTKKYEEMASEFKALREKIEQEERDGKEPVPVLTAEQASGLLAMQKRFDEWESVFKEGKHYIEDSSLDEFVGHTLKKSVVTTNLFDSLQTIFMQHADWIGECKEEASHLSTRVERLESSLEQKKDQEKQEKDLALETKKKSLQQEIALRNDKVAELGEQLLKLEEKKTKLLLQRRRIIYSFVFYFVLVLVSLFILFSQSGS